MASPFVSEFEFVLNGQSVRASGSANTSLLAWLRKSGKTGSKEGCAEGDCGACTVAVVDTNARGERTYRAVNSCITLLPMVAGREIVTVEGVASPDGLHPVQQAMVNRYGSQCGYCTPGFVVSMFEAYYRDDLGEGEVQKARIGDQLNGNLCRCTGYRPIRDAMLDALDKKAKSGQGQDLFQVRLGKHHGLVPELAYASEGTVFHRPKALAELLRLKAEHGSELALVAGATEIGVYINKQHRPFPRLLSTEGVPELRAVTKDETHWTIGGAVTLTSLEEALSGEYPMLDKMFAVFASRQIRSRATLAGNLVTASPIGDMAPLMLALDAEIVLESTDGARTLPLSEFFLGYRKTALASHEIVRAIRLPRNLPPAEGTTRTMESYKVSKRRELDISITAAGFVVDVGPDNVVVRARLGYGGVAAMPSRAKQTEAFLVGKPWNEATLEGALGVLSAEFSPISDHRSGAPYRRTLVGSLFEKFFRGDKSEAQDEPIVFERTGAKATSEDLDGSSGPERKRADGRGLAHESARGHVTGDALYVDDVSRRRDMLEVWPVTSPHAHARILSIDTSGAKASPGVACVLTAKDVPGQNDVGAVRHDEPLFATDLVSYNGQLIALVVGESYEACRLAAAKVSVEYEPLPAILGAKEAVAKGSFHTEPHVISRGDVKAELARAQHTLEGEIEIGGQEHFYLESQAAWAEVGEDRELFVTSSTQHPSEVQAVLSHVLALPRSKVTVQSPRMGGGFGGKETQGNACAALVALAAHKTGRAVRVQLDRDLDMTMTGKRHPFYAKYEVGYTGDGKITAVRVNLYADGGYALDLSESIDDRGLFHLDNSYYLPAVHFEGRVLKTNVTSHTAFRGFGGPQGMLVIEEILARVARRLGLAPEVVREKNLYHGEGETNTTHYGQELGDQRLGHIWSRLMETSRFSERRAAISAFNEASPRIKRGLAITPVKFGISFTATFLNQAGALVLVYRDGTIQVNHGGTEMGQGLYTKILGIAMRELGVSEGRIRMMRTQTDKVPNTSATAASSGSDLNGQAVRLACETLRERLAPVAAELIGKESGVVVPESAVVFERDLVRAPQVPGVTASFERIVEQAYLKQVPLSATGFYRTPGIGYDRTKGRGKPFYYFAYGAAVSEVEVDGYSGMKRVRAVDILHDVGESLNPGVDRGQIEGGFVQGVGWLTGEELLWSPDGRLLTHSASTYQIPAIGDAPARMNIELLPNAAQDGVIHGSKAVGEPPLMLALSVREAIRDAIGAFARATSPAPAEVWLASPATHEAILAAIELWRGDREVASSSARAAE